MSPRMLVTGATGLLGSHVVDEARNRGWTVRALVREPARANGLRTRDVELTEGDLLSAASLRRAAEGCEAVVHAAAVIGAGTDLESFRAGNVAGTENVLDASAWAGARLVHVSSTAVFGQERYRERPTDEAVALPELPEWDAYGRTKQEAERAVLRDAEGGRVWAAVVRPPLMYGPRDRQFVPRVAPALRFGVAPLPAAGLTTLPLVHARSVAQGILAALERAPKSGSVYHLTEDRPVTVADLIEGAGRGLGVRLRRVPIPRPLAAAGFAGLAAFLVLTGRADVARRASGAYRMVTRPNPFSCERARAELGWRPELDPVEALTDAFRWWRERRARGRS